MTSKQISEYLAAIGSKGGKVTSKAKAKAARANWKKVWHKCTYCDANTRNRRSEAAWDIAREEIYICDKCIFSQEG